MTADFLIRRNNINTYLEMKINLYCNNNRKAIMEILESRNFIIEDNAPASVSLFVPRKHKESAFILALSQYIKVDKNIKIMEWGYLPNKH